MIAARSSRRREISVLLLATVVCVSACASSRTSSTANDRAICTIAHDVDGQKSSLYLNQGPKPVADLFSVQGPKVDALIGRGVHDPNLEKKARAVLGTGALMKLAMRQTANDASLSAARALQPWSELVHACDALKY
jgi:hypothetical protein